MHPHNPHSYLLTTNLKGKVVKETNNSWMFSDNIQISSNLRYRNKKGRLKHENTKFNVRLCIKCNRPYENNTFTNDGTAIYYYKDFPTYKLERKVCDICNGNT